MVKADLTRDYYGDLEIAPTADINEVKKQFKRLALQYHPDRNPGRESEVTAAFQKIQSAHEVLTDPQERAKYDANRVRPSNRYQTGGNQRGNPWSTAGSQWAPPPKAPTARAQPPPPSAGAQRYKHFETPKHSSSQFAQDGPEARKSTYQAWEHMRNSGKGREVPPVPPYANGTPRTGREESDGYKHRPHPKAAFGHKANYSGDSPRRAQSTSAQQRTGFMPNTSVGDEPAAPRNSYFTSQRKSSQAPEPPPRNNPPPPTHNAPVDDPLAQFKEESNTPYEPRLSTPYATHGGEKLNPFESPNMNRSKSTREPHGHFAGSPNIPQTGSDSNLKKNTNSTRPRTSAPRNSSAEATMYSSDDSSSHSSPKGKTYTNYENQPFAKTRTFTPASQHESLFSTATEQNSAQVPSSGRGQKTNVPNGSAYPHQPSRGESMYDRLRSYTHPLPPIGKVIFGKSSTPGAKFPTVSEALSSKKNQMPHNVSEPDGFAGINCYTQGAPNWKDPSPYEGPNAESKPATPPSGVTTYRLFPLEEAQRSVLDNLITSKNRTREAPPAVSARHDGTQPSRVVDPLRPQGENGVLNNPHFLYDDGGQFMPACNDPMNQTGNTYRYPVEPESPWKQQRSTIPEFHNPFGHSRHRHLDSVEAKLKSNANHYDLSSFNFKVDENTFQPTNSIGLSSSTENINTKFTPEEWEGTFQAGAFQPPEQKAANVPRNTRANSGSRSRGRSPVKVRPSPTIDPQYVPGSARPVHDPHYIHQTHSEPDMPSESSGGTKFSQADWAGTFKPQTFMAPGTLAPSKTPSRTTRKARGTSIRQTAGNAAIIIDSSSDSGNEKPLFTGRKSFASAQPPQSAQPAQSAQADPPSPNAMDVDTPPAFKPAASVHGPPDSLNATASPGKRQAVPSRNISPVDQEALKVNFEDMKIQDLISTLDLPKPPVPAKDIAILAANVRSQITDVVWEVHLGLIAEYMKEWDLFNNRILLHLVARKNQNDALGEKRWTDEAGMRKYRLGLREDKFVLAHLASAEKAHEEVVKNQAIIRERMTKMLERQREPPRKKVS